jgi:hypothetical protein
MAPAMVYDMEYKYRVFSFLILGVLVSAGSAGCLSGVFGPAPAYNQPVTATPSQTAAANATISDMALQPADLPPDYILQDRSLAAYGGISQIDRGLGWQQGYEVSYYRMDKKHDDMTDIIQQISTYEPANINLVYRIKHDALLPAGDNASGYQIPFPITGDQSAAWRTTTGSQTGSITSYNLIFVKNNVFEQITMEGTTTDSELLKAIGQAAAARIH